MAACQVSQVVFLVLNMFLPDPPLATKQGRVYPGASAMAPASVPAVAPDTDQAVGEMQSRPRHNSRAESFLQLRFLRLRLRHPKARRHKCRLRNKCRLKQSSKSPAPSCKAAQPGEYSLSTRQQPNPRALTARSRSRSRST